MKKIIALSLALLMIMSIMSLTSCNSKEESDLTNIDDYVAPSYNVDIGTGIITFADGTGETAVITGYTPTRHEAHVVIIPEKVGQDRIVTAIGDEAFKACTAMGEVVIPETVTSIGKAAFYSCDNLRKITIPASVKFIGELAFANCDGIFKVDFAEGSALLEIGKNAFDGCVALETITLPEKLTTIGSGAFRNCAKLQKVEIPESVKEIGVQAYVGCASLNYDGCIVLTDKIENLGGFDPNAKDPATVIVFDTNKAFIKAPEGSYAAAFVNAMR